MSIVSGLAAEIYDLEVAEATGAARNTEVVLISGWLEANIGTLNLLINSSFCAGDLTATGHQEERAIIRELYNVKMFEKRGLNVLKGADGSSSDMDFQTLREGDSVITRSNRNTVAANYRKLQERAEMELKDLVHNYNMYHSKPSQIYGDD